MEYEQNIVQLNTDIEKIQIKKHQIIKWIYLQIQVKEKKLILPNFYKKIIESSKSEILSLQSKFYEKEVFKRESKKEVNKSGSSKKKNNYLSKKSIVNNSLFKKTSEKFGSGKLNNNKIKNLNNIKEKEKENSNSNKVISLVINNIKENITKEDFDKVLFWRYSPIFKTAEEFIETLKSFDTQNIYLLKYYNQIQSKIFDSLNELRKIINSKDKTNIIENQIKDKINELEKRKNRYKNLHKIYSNIKEDNNIKRKPTYDILLSNDSKNNKPKININKLYFKINIILDNCKIINNTKLIEYLDYNRKKSNSKEEEIIYIFEFIECTIDYLIEKIRLYRRDEYNNEFLQKIMYDIEKRHKREKPDRQRLEDLERRIKLLKKIENKNNKVFLSNRKIDYF